MIAARPELAIPIIDYARWQGRISMAEMLRFKAASRDTLKDHFRSLVEKGHLTRFGTGKSCV